MRASRPPEWTDPNESDPGITLVELFAFLGESLTYLMQPRQRRRLAIATLLLVAVWKLRSDRAE